MVRRMKRRIGSGLARGLIRAERRALRIALVPVVVLLERRLVRSLNKPS